MNNLLQLWYEQVLSVTDEVDAEPRVPRTVGRQLGRDNMEHNSAEDYYRWTIALPLLDHLTHQMQERFGEQQILASKLVCLNLPFFVRTLL